jgi:hypothetical protein
MTIRGLVRYVVFFVMKLKTRAVEIAGITSEPDGAWMTQIARNLTDPSDGILRGVQHIILDRDPLYTAAFRRLLRDSGMKPLVLPVWSPNLDAVADRFVESAKSECLERIVVRISQLGHEQRTDAGDHAIMEPKAWRTLLGAIENQQLLLEEQRFGHHGPHAAGPSEPSDGRQHITRRTTSSRTAQS